jgi:hypothetical protein
MNNATKVRVLAELQFGIVRDLQEVLKEVGDPYVKARIQMLLKQMYMSVGELICIATILETGGEKVYC